MCSDKIRRYWPMKSEPSCFSFEDLKQSPKQTTCWDGVRNYQARNLLWDDIKKGDGVLFYHSNIKTPSIVGIAEVIGEGYPDYTAWDPKSEHYDPKSSFEKPIWYMVDIQYVVALKQPVTRDDLKEHPVLEKMGVMKRGNRLSVMPVEKKEWMAVLDLAGAKDPFALSTH